MINKLPYLNFHTPLMWAPFVALRRSIHLFVRLCFISQYSRKKEEIFKAENLHKNHVTCAHIHIYTSHIFPFLLACPFLCRLACALRFISLVYALWQFYSASGISICRHCFSDTAAARYATQHRKSTARRDYTNHMSCLHGQIILIYIYKHFILRYSVRIYTAV